jgi:signal transduction histidine kinase
MPSLFQARRNIETSWRSFVVDGRPPSSVRPAIVRSWERARSEWHVPPSLRTSPRAIGADELLARAEDEAVRLASPLVARFAERLAADGHVVAYFDAEGVMLAIDGSSRSRGRLADINFAPGSSWAEKDVGTNGPGTALVEGAPIEVFASEHFVEAWQAWSCASVPVRFRGRVVGAVDITSPWTARNPSLLLTAEALAQTIESQLEAEAANQDRATLLRVARDAVRARDDFLASASHELKTPLTPLRLKLGRIQQLLARGGDLDRAELGRALAGVDRHMSRVVGFVDELLEMSRFGDEPPRLTLEPTDLAAIVRGVIERVRPDLDRYGCELSLTVSGDAQGLWDAAQIARAFGQLLLNAMKYAPGRIEVEIEAGNRSARLTVRDHGPGIAPGDRGRIFFPFERAVECRNHSGLGLGLHAVRAIVEAHGGEVRLESTGEGSTFTVELPLGGCH